MSFLFIFILILYIVICSALMSIGTKTGMSNTIGWYIPIYNFMLLAKAGNINFLLSFLAMITILFGSVFANNISSTIFSSAINIFACGISAYIWYNIASKYNRNKIIWSILGFIVPFLNIIYFAIVRPK